MESQRLVSFIRPSREKGALVIGLSAPDEKFTVGHALYLEIGELHGGDVLSEETVSRIRDEDERRRAKRSAIAMLAYADNSCRRLYTKLCRKGFRPALATETVEMLVAEGLLVEARQLESAVLSLAEHKLYGPYRILSALAAKGYKSAEIREAIHAASENRDVDFSKNAKLLIEKKLGAEPSVEEKRKLLFTYGYKR